MKSHYKVLVFFANFFEDESFTDDTMKATKVASQTASPSLKKIERTFWDKFRCVGLVSFAGFSGYVGAWQITRRKEKIEYLNGVTKGLKSEASECPKHLTCDDISKLKYHKVYFNGKLDIDDEIVVTPARPPPSLTSRLGITTETLTATYGIGGEAITPCTLDSGEIILVNRGWIAQKTASEMHPDDNINDNINDKKNKKNEKETFSKMIGLIKPYELMYGADYGDTLDTNYLFWPYLTKEAIYQRWNKIKSQMLDNENEIPITIQLVDEKGGGTNDDVTFPVAMTEYDYLNVAVPPGQHMTYIFISFGSALISAWYAYHCWKHPPSMAKMAKMVIRKKAPKFKYRDTFHNKR